MSDPEDTTKATAVPSTKEPVNPAPSQEGENRWERSGLAHFGDMLLRALLLASVLVGGIFLLGVAQRVGWIRDASGTSSESGGEHQHGGVAAYACPMHPQIKQSSPGDCPICGMKLAQVNSSASSKTSKDERYVCPMLCTPASKEPGRCPVCAMELVEASGGGDGNSVTLDPAARRLIGIQTEKAKLGPVSQTIRTIGSIRYDESKLATISAYVPGRIEALYANYVGVPVSKGDDLALIYSPDLYSAQVEFLTATQSGGLKRLGSSSNLQGLAKQKLIELGLTEDQVEDIRASGKPESRMRVRSPIQGTVIGKHAVEGDYLKTGDKIYRVADLSTVWLMLDLYPDDAARIRFGQKVEAEVASLPGTVFSGRVAFIDPTVDETTRTVSVRVEMPNPEGGLRPGDFATARIQVEAVRQDRIYDPELANKYISPMHPQVIQTTPGDCPICGMDLIPTTRLGYANQPLPQQEVITIPRDAVLMTGVESVVYVEADPGRFEIRRVSLGPMADDRAVVIEGLSPGETVATNGNFLIDSQMQLAGNPSLMDPAKANMYPPGPLPLPLDQPILLSGESSLQFDQAYAAYFEIQRALAADRMPSVNDIQALNESLANLLESQQVPDKAKSQLQSARSALERMSESLELARLGFRRLSHALLRTATQVRGDATANKLVHMFCPMVPGGGGDWMQAEGELVNPYWGSEMLHCGEQVREMSVASDPGMEDQGEPSNPAHGEHP